MQSFSDQFLLFLYYVIGVTVIDRLRSSCCRNPLGFNFSIKIELMRMVDSLINDCTLGLAFDPPFQLAPACPHLITSMAGKVDAGKEATPASSRANNSTNLARGRLTIHERGLTSRRRHHPPVDHRCGAHVSRHARTAVLAGWPA
jgi:hypothetical protein